jgi:type IV pilus assembly protein PilC
MIKFSYRAKDKEGKTIRGLVEAENTTAAALILKERGLLPFFLKSVKEDFLKGSFIRFLDRVTLGDLAAFTRQLSTMVTAGLALPESLRVLRDQSKPALALAIDDVLKKVEGGKSLSDSLAAHETVFGQVYVALVGAGETAGVLDQVLGRLADNLERQREFEGKVKGAMIYPAIIVLGMLAVGLLMMVFVVPKLTSMYLEFGAQLPLPTRILILVSTLLSKFWWLLAILAVGFIWLFRAALGIKKFKVGFDSFKLKLPLVGSLQKQIALAEATRTLGLLVSTGIPIVEALNTVAASLTNSVLAEGLEKTAAKVEKGLPVGFSLAEDENFPPIVSQMLSVGEETGKIDEVLAKLSVYFSTESEQAVKGLTTAIEPIIMVVLGVGVGFLIISIIMPMYSLTSQF